MPPRPASGWPAALRLARDPRSIAIHARDTWHPDILRGKFDFFEILTARAAAEGWTVHAMPGASRASRWLRRRGPGLHLLVADRPAYGPRLLHALPGYVWGFWYLDEIGPNADSSLRHAEFHPGLVDPAAARHAFDGIAGHMLRHNVSRFPQAGRQALPQAAAALFCQDIDDFRTSRPYLDTETMVETVVTACAPDPVLIKLHPRQRPARADRLRTLADRHPNARITEASVHDISAAARVVVTQNSAAGFEALLQEKPVITCALTDYHHATLVARSPDALRTALREAPEHAASFDHPAYVAWFLTRRLLEPQAPDFADRLWARLMAKAAV